MSSTNDEVLTNPQPTSQIETGQRSMAAQRIRDAWALLATRLLAPVDNASIVTFRVVFGLLMCWEVNRYFQNGWIDAIYVDPGFLFSYHGFGWIQALPGPLMHAHFLVLGLLALCIVVGFMYRVAMPLFFIGFTYVFLLEKAHYLNHLYLVCLIAFIMIFVPANTAFSIDALRNPKIRSKSAPTWALVLLATQVGVAYFYGGLAKLNWDWFAGEPMRIWMANETQFPVLGRWFTDEWMVYLVTYGGLLFDLLIVPALLWPRTRWFAVVAVVVFHRFNAEMFSIGIFPMFGTLSVVLFLPPDLPRKVVNKVLGNKERRQSPKRVVEKGPAGWFSLPNVMPFSSRSSVERWTVILVVAFLAIQLLLPFRHWLYPGNTAWTDQGDRFAWRMMLVSKTGDISFEVLDPATGQSWEVDPSDYLTSSQKLAMTSQPDMILQFSHYLAGVWAEDGFDEVEVRAITSVSLNGREPYPIVDPTVDLADKELTLFNADWITSIEELEREAENSPAESSVDGD